MGELGLGVMGWVNWGWGVGWVNWGWEVMGWVNWGVFGGKVWWIGVVGAMVDLKGFGVGCVRWWGFGWWVGWNERVVRVEEWLWWSERMGRK